MLYEFIAVIAAGFLGGGVALVLRTILRGLAPRWLTPVFAGLAMIFTTTVLEYGWADRTEAAMPEGFEVISRIESQAWYKPWTYAFPTIHRLMAVNSGGALRNPAAPDLVISDILLYQRFTGPRLVPVLVDCAGARRADISDGITFDEEGQPRGDLTWFPMEEGEPLLAALCTQG
ncbi:MAG: hypothetical protein ACPGID_03915 [Rubricella sp.]